MKFIVSNFNTDLEWILEYTDDYVVYNRGDSKVAHLDPAKVLNVPNIGSDIFDKLTYIVQNYDHLPEIAVYTKGNLFKYISPLEFDELYDTDSFTPLLTQDHPTHLPACFYDNEGMYHELNDYAYLNVHPAKNEASIIELVNLLNMTGKNYVAFAPGSNYIVPRINILKHPKIFYEKLLTFLDWTVYPGEAMMVERSLYSLWL